MIKLNTQQQNIINTSLDKNIRIIACAGSGKTTTITCKIAYMINTLNCKPSEFFIATFTNNAGYEMRERINKLLGHSIDILCGTFHSLSLKLLNKYKPINKIIHIDESQFLFYELLKTNINLGIKYIFIDEYQDINNIQHKIIKKLYNNALKLVVVGDDSQNIYTFRGSNIKYILNFDNYYNNTITHSLINNYRSHNNIINVANNSISINKNQIKKNMIAIKQDIIKPKIIYYDTLGQELYGILNSIKSYKDKNNIAILCRNNIPLYFIEEKLIKEGINCIIISGDNKNNIKKDCVILSTIHSSKGLEWDIIYIMGMSDTFFPSKKDEISIEEERRLFYVAITRCKSELIMTYSGKKKYITRFISELDQKLFDWKFKKCKFKLSKSEPDFNKTSVIGLINNLNGNNYIEMRKLGLIPEINYKLKTYYNTEYKYADFIEKHNIYSEFGVFLDYLIRKMLGVTNDIKADIVIKQLYLNKIETELYSKYYDKLSKTDTYNLYKYWKGILKFGDNEPELNGLLRKLYFKMKTFKEIQITFKNYLPPNFINHMEKCYCNFMNPKLDWRNILYDIWSVSKSHTISFNRKSILYKKIKPENILSYCDLYNDIYNMITKISNGHTIICNPALSSEIIGEADLIIGKTLIDIKTSYSHELQMEHIMQTLCYAYLARQNGYKINNIGIINPLLGYYYKINIKKWKLGKKLIDYLIKQNL